MSKQSLPTFAWNIRENRIGHSRGTPHAHASCQDYFSSDRNISCMSVVPHKVEKVRLQFKFVHAYAIIRLGGGAVSKLTPLWHRIFFLKVQFLSFRIIVTQHKAEYKTIYSVHISAWFVFFRDGARLCQLRQDGDFIWNNAWKQSKRATGLNKKDSVLRRVWHSYCGSKPELQHHWLRRWSKTKSMHKTMHKTMHKWNVSSDCGKKNGAIFPAGRITFWVQFGMRTSKCCDPANRQTIIRLVLFHTGCYFNKLYSFCHIFMNHI